MSRLELARALVDSIPSAVMGIDGQGCVQLLNDSARRLLRELDPAASPALGQPASELLSAQPRLAALLLGALSGRPGISRAEIALPGAAGTHTVGFTLCPVRDAQGDVTGAALLLRDLTPFERWDERERQRERLAALGQMAAGMAHEIRNPLAGMEVIAGLLRRRLSGEDRELAAELSEQIAQVADIVSASLDFVRPIELRRDPVDPAAWLDAALRRGTARCRIPLTVERDVASPLPELTGDESLLVTALANLVGNACDAMAAGATEEPAHLVLRVRVARSQRGAPAAPPREREGEATLCELAWARELVVTVEDSGPGIDPSERERIFYPFYTTKQNGSGIGLAQAQKIAMAHGGCVSVDCDGGCDGERGARFHLHLPVEAAER